MPFICAIFYRRVFQKTPHNSSAPSAIPNQKRTRKELAHPSRDLTGLQSVFAQPSSPPPPSPLTLVWRYPSRDTLPSLSHFRRTHQSLSLRFFALHMWILSPVQTHYRREKIFIASYISRPSAASVRHQVIPPYSASSTHPPHMPFPGSVSARSTFPSYPAY